MSMMRGGGMGLDISTVMKAARVIGQDIAKTKEELERLVNMIEKDQIVEKKKVKKKIKSKDKDGKEIEIESDTEFETIEESREAKVEDIISALIILCVQDEKFRTKVPDKLIEQLNLVRDAIKDYENRGLDVKNVKNKLRGNVLIILKRAYPSWNSLVPGSTTHMVNAMVQNSQQQGQLRGLPQFQLGMGQGPQGQQQPINEF